MYYGIFFTEEIKRRLLRVASAFLTIPEDWVTYLDHITLIHSSDENWEAVSRILENFEDHCLSFRVTGLGMSGNALAFRVSVQTANKVSHITIATREGHSPAESNQITEWDRVYCEEEFYGKVKFSL